MNRKRAEVDSRPEQLGNTHKDNPVSSESWSDSLIDGTDTVALGQYLDTRGAQWDLQPEKKLMLAMLQDGIDCFRKNLGATGEKKSALFQEAEEWILTEGNTYLFSFDSICEAFDIDPNYLRRGLLNYKRAEQSKRAA